MGTESDLGTCWCGMVSSPRLAPYCSRQCRDTEPSLPPDEVDDCVKYEPGMFSDAADDAVARELAPHADEIREATSRVSDAMTGSTEDALRILKDVDPERHAEVMERIPSVSAPTETISAEPDLGPNGIGVRCWQLDCGAWTTNPDGVCDDHDPRLSVQDLASQSGSAEDPYPVSEFAPPGRGVTYTRSSPHTADTFVNSDATDYVVRLENALYRIGTMHTDPRPDGTFNYSRAAIIEIAREALNG